jgi:hypothetical protein
LNTCEIGYRYHASTAAEATASASCTGVESLLERNIAKKAMV